MSLRSRNAATLPGLSRPFRLLNAFWGAFLSLFVVAALTVSAAPVAAQTGQLGVNIAGPVDYDPGGQIFTDIMKQARHFGSVNTPWDEAAPTDANGWPTGDAAVVASGGSLPHIEGTYKLTFTGNAAVSPVACNFAVQNKIYNSGTNTTTADIVVPAGEAGILLAFTGQPGGVKNIRLIRPGYPADGSVTFTTPFLNALQYFTVMRGMDYLATNSNNPPYGTPILWSNRRVLTDATQADGVNKKGGCYEYLIQLANQTGKDLWVNVPYGADDNYVSQLATLLKNTLNSGRVVYVEYSNEVWNYGFQQAQDNKQGAQDEINAGGSNLNYDGDGDIYRLACRRYGRRTAQIAQIFRSVYGVQFTARVRPVLAWQSQGADYGVSDALKFIGDNYETPSNLIYAIANAPYMEIDDANTGSVSSILSNWSSYSDTENKTNNQRYRAVANSYNLHYITYEGGTSESQGMTNLSAKIAANRDSGVTSLIVKDIRTNFWGQGGELYMYYTLASTYGQYGCWGLTEDLTNLNTPKFDAIRQLIGGVVPGAPTGLSAAAGNARITLTWNAVSGATSYNVYRGTTAGSESTTAIAAGITGTTYANTSLTNGTTYYYKIKAVNSNGVSGYSNEASATPTNGGGGGNVTSVRFWPRDGFADRMTGGKFQASNDNSSWTDLATVSTQPPGNAWTSLTVTTPTTWRYVRYLSPNGGYGNVSEVEFYNGSTKLTGTKIGTPGSWNNGSNTFDKAEDGNTGTFFDAPNGNGNFVGLDLQGTPPAPAAPTGLTATGGNAQINLSWTASSGATSYNVKRSTTSGSGYTTVASPAGTSYTNTGLTNGTTYYYVVTAVNANGESGNSNQASATPQAPTPTMVTLNPTDDTDTQSDNASGTNVNVSCSQYNTIYVRFDLSSVTGTVTSAKFRMYKIYSGTAAVTLSQTTFDNWIQSNRSNLPGIGGGLTTTNAADPAGYVEFDLTAFVQSRMSGSKIVSFAMTTPLGTWTTFNSKEGGSKPQLVITKQ